MGAGNIFQFLATWLLRLISSAFLAICPSLMSSSPPPWSDQVFVFICPGWSFCSHSHYPYPTIPPGSHLPFSRRIIEPSQNEDDTSLAPLQPNVTMWVSIIRGCEWKSGVHLLAQAFERGSFLLTCLLHVGGLIPALPPGSLSSHNSDKGCVLRM